MGGAEDELEPLADSTSEGILWPDPRSGPYYLVAHWSDRSSGTECVGLEVWKGVIPDAGRTQVRRIPDSEESGPLGGTELRGLRLPTILSALWRLQQQAETEEFDRSGGWASLRAWLEQMPADALHVAVSEDPGALEAFTEGLSEIVEALPPLRFQEATRRQKRGDLTHLAQVAAVYERAARDPLPRPTKAIAETFHVSHSTATKWAKQARDEGLLPPTTPGRPSQQTTRRESP